MVALCSRCSKTVPAEEDRTRRMRAGVCSCIIPGPMIGCQSQASEVSDQILGRMRSHSAQSYLLTRLPAVGSSPSARLHVCRSSQAIFSPAKGRTQPLLCRYARRVEKRSLARQSRRMSSYGQGNAGGQKKLAHDLVLQKCRRWLSPPIVGGRSDRATPVLAWSPR